MTDAHSTWKQVGSEARKEGKMTELKRDMAAMKLHVEQAVCAHNDRLIKVIIKFSWVNYGS